MNAQRVTLSGIVSDSLAEPLVYTTLIAKPLDSTMAMQYSVANVKGEYKLELNKNDSYHISVSSLGFKTLEFNYDAMENLEKNIILFEDAFQLETVIVELPILVRKDTVTYKIDKFTTGEERKLKDILKKLPGIDVNEDGSVTSKGKKITHLLVENKNFFGGNTKLGIENIPANSINMIEVIDDYNEISFLKGMTKTENMALNIKLKENKKKFVFGDVEAGIGNESYNKTHTNLFYYHPKLNLNFIGGSNNIGEKTFSYSDYKNFLGGPSGVFNLRDFSVEKNSISQDIESADEMKNENKIGALNITKIVNDKIDLSSFIILSDANNENLKQTKNEYLLSNSNYFERVNNEGNAKRKLGIGKLSLKYTPNAVEQWSLKMLVKSKNNYGQTSIVSNIEANEISIQNSKDSDESNISGNLEWHKKIAKKQALSSSFNLQYDKINSDGFWETNRPISNSLIPYETADFYLLSLIRRTQEKSLNAIFKHYWTINNFNLIQTTIGNHIGKNLFFTNDSQLLDDGSTNDFTENGFGNDLNFELNDFYLGTYYNLTVGKFEFEQSLFLHNYSWMLSQSNDKKINKWILLPNFSVKTGSKSRKGFLRFDTGLKNSFSNASRLASRYYLQSYNSVFVGDENLENELQHSTSLTYSKSNLFRGLYFLGVLNYVYKIDGITNSIENDGQNSLFSSVILNKPNENINGTLIVKKNFKNFKYDLTARVFSTKSSELINSTISEYKNTNGSYRLSAQTSHKDFPIIEIGIKKSFGSYSTSSTSNKFTTNEPFFKFNYDFLKKFVFLFDYTNYNYRNKEANITNSFNISNASFSYGKESSAWNFKLSGQNLFDIRYKNQNSFNIYIISDSRTYILPRVLMASIIYKL